MAKHRLVQALALMAALTFVVPAAAQTLTAPPQVLTLDQDRLYLDSRFGKALEARALAANQALAAENRKIEADLANEEAELTKKRPTMPAAAFQPLADAFDAKVEQRRTDQAAKIEALKAQHDAGRKAFFQAVVPVLADMMRQMGAYAMLNREAVVLSFDAIDVTDRAIKAVDEKIGDGSTLLQGPRAPDPTTNDPSKNDQPTNGSSTDGYLPGTLQQDNPSTPSDGPTLGVPEDAAPGLPDPTSAAPGTLNPDAANPTGTGTVPANPIAPAQTLPPTGLPDPAPAAPTIAPPATVKP